MFDKRISIFTGHFGSGKTEVAVNYAVELAKRSNKTAIVDFDIVNPYFRTADVKKELEKQNIWVVTPVYANTNVDVPALPPEINTLFEKKEYKVVLDVGGDDLGARVLARYYKDISADNCEVFFVVNTRRPMTDTEDKIIEMVSGIECSSRLKITKLVSNTNLLQDTSLESILEGYAVVKRVSEKLKIPIAFVSGFCETMDKVGSIIGDELLYMNKYIKLPWD